MSFSKIVYFCLALVIGVSCNKHPQRARDQKPLILVSIAPYKRLAEKVAGSAFRVEGVVPAAANPHSFEPTSHQVIAMGEAQVWLRIGEPFEKKLVPILQANNPELSVADLRDGIDMLEESSNCKQCCIDHFDRHIWLSPKLAKQQARIIERVLSEKYPEHQQSFHNNLAALCEELDALDLEIHATLEGVTNRTFLVSHSAFAYFCKDFDLVQLSVEYEGKAPRPKHLEEILNKAISNNAHLALALPQHNNKGASLIAAKLNKPLKYIDPYSENYFETMKQLAKWIADPHAD